MYNKLILLTLMLSLFVVDVFASDQKIGLAQILKMAQKKHNVTSLAKSKREAFEFQATDESSIDNPVVSYGVGRLRYNGGTGTADFDELTVSQKISINGSKSSLKNQGQLLGEIAGIEGTQDKISFSGMALLSGVRFFIAKEKFKHVEERRKFFLLVSRFLKSRKFRSPQKQIEVQLIESKLEEVLLETNEIKIELDLAKETLSLYIGGFSGNSIEIDLLESSKLKALTQEFSKKELADKSKFSKLQKYLESEEKTAERQWIPDLQFYYSQSNEKYSGGNKNQVLGIGLEVPLFNMGRNKKYSVLAKKNVVEAEYEIKKSRNLSLKNSFIQKIRVGLEYVAIYNSDKIKKREKALVKFERDFKKGLISAANFLEFEDSVHMIHNRTLESQYEVYSGLLGLIELAGDEAAIKELL